MVENDNIIAWGSIGSLTIFLRDRHIWVSKKTHNSTGGFQVFVCLFYVLYKISGLFLKNEYLQNEF